MNANPPPPPRPRSAREIDAPQRRAGRTRGGNRPRDWAALGVFAAALLAAIGVIALSD